MICAKLSTLFSGTTVRRYAMICARTMICANYLSPQVLLALEMTEAVKKYLQDEKRKKNKKNNPKNNPKVEKLVVQKVVVVPQREVGKNKPF